MVVDSVFNKNKELNNNNMLKIENSQNFLHSKKLVVKLIERSNINKNDIIIEIGPGKGIITKELSIKSKKVYGIEYDLHLYKKLKHMFSDIKNVEIIYENFLEFELPEKYKYKIFSSIPFNITAEILLKITSCSNPPKDTYIIIQEEAARKYAGNPYNNECMRSLLLKPYFDFEIIYKLKNTDFTPIPKVNSVLLHIKKRENILINQNEAELYRDFIAYVFSSSGKSIKERCKYIFSHKQLKRLSQDIGFQTTDSPVNLSFEQWLRIFQYFIVGVSIDKQRLVYNSYSRHLNEQKKIDKVHRNFRS